MTRKMMCGTCKRILNMRWSLIGGLPEWWHGGSRQTVDGHPAVPVPADETVVGVCDFCCLHPPLWVYFGETSESVKRLVEPKADEEVVQFAKHWGRVDQPGEITSMTQHLYDEGWAACEGCSPFVERRDVNRLISHVKAEVAAAGLQPVTRRYLAAQWQGFFATIKPGRIPARPPGVVS